MDASRFPLAARFGVTELTALRGLAEELQPLLGQQNSSQSDRETQSPANSSSSAAPSQLFPHTPRLAIPNPESQGYQRINAEEEMESNSNNSFESVHPPRPSNSVQGVHFPRIPNLENPSATDSVTNNFVQALQTLVRQNSTTTSSTNHDLQLVSNKNQLSQIIQQDCPSSFSGRRNWLKNVQVILTNNPSGIVWKETNSLLPCYESTPNSQLINKIFTFSRTIQLSVIFDYIDGNQFITQSDSEGSMRMLQLPPRIITQISKTMYALLIAKIPIEEGSHFHQNVATFDGIALIRALRSTTDDLSKSLIDTLDARADTIHFNNISDWLAVRGELMQLKNDYDTSVRDGTISLADSMTDRKFKKLLVDKVEKLLPDIYKWCHTDVNTNRPWTDALVHCDVLVAAAVRQLALQTPTEANTSMQQQLSPIQPDPGRGR